MGILEYVVVEQRCKLHLSPLTRPSLNLVHKIREALFALDVIKEVEL
jgi:hypothetical protein